MTRAPRSPNLIQVSVMIDCGQRATADFGETIIGEKKERLRKKWLNSVTLLPLGRVDALDAFAIAPINIYCCTSLYGSIPKLLHVTRLEYYIVPKKIKDQKNQIDSKMIRSSYCSSFTYFSRWEMGRILNAQRRSMGTVKNRPTVKVPDVSANAAGRDIIDGSKSSQSPGWQYRPCQQAELLMRQICISVCPTNTK